MPLRFYLGVNAMRIGDASAVSPVVTLVDVGTTLSVKAGVFEADALDGRSREARWARVTTEARHHVEAPYSRVARIG